MKDTKRFGKEFDESNYEIMKLAGEECVRLREENEKLKEALRKCSPMTIDEKDGLRLTCKFCKGIKNHTDDCEYAKLIK